MEHSEYTPLNMQTSKARTLLKATRNEKQLLVDNSRNYTALAWFSHHGSGCGGNCEMDRPSGETKKHWHAKHILSEHASRYWFIAEKCTG